jgi:hypothetical protein
VHRDEFGERLKTEWGKGGRLVAEANDEEAPMFRVHSLEPGSGISEARPCRARWHETDGERFAPKAMSYGRNYAGSLNASDRRWSSVRRVASFGALRRRSPRSSRNEA